MCSSIGDGAAAILICSEEYARKIRARPVFIRDSSIVSASGQDGADLAAVRAAREAYAQAGMGSDEVHVAKLHDASAPAELIHYENLEFRPPCGVPQLICSGVTDIGGRISVNPSGGLLSCGHPVGATGAAQIVELTHQLHGETGARQRSGARVTLDENNGGRWGGDSTVALVTILSV
ncbi:thiolase family protein [Cupriavidus basilensis]|uniref:thiolase family protein n=1 Tax=Cupriavidus basilensis TaxID=68895 RepID=UPI0023E763E6|nr:thiolase family protein [Cupriavidus basilensis]MDF3887552.1 thiolase family protein [Cupriavidus basilensis]